jgi:hypothetical protein
MRRSNVLSLPLQLVFPALTNFPWGFVMHQHCGLVFAGVKQHLVKIFWRHNTQLYDIQHQDIQHNNIITFSVTTGTIKG